MADAYTVLQPLLQSVFLVCFFFAFHTFSMMKNNLELKRTIFSCRNYGTATANRAAGRISNNRVLSPGKSVEECNSKEPNKIQKKLCFKTAVKRNMNIPLILSYMNYFSIVKGYGIICIPMYSKNYIKTTKSLFAL